jgi:hypothetical protein
MLFSVVLALAMGGFGHVLREKSARAEYPEQGAPNMEDANVLRELSYVVRGLVSLSFVLMMFVSFASGHVAVGLIVVVLTAVWLLSFISIHEVIGDLRRGYLATH